MSAVTGAAPQAPAEAPLTLAPHCVAIPGDGALHLITRRGAFDLRGRDVARLHERLSPFLRGSHTRQQLLAAVSPALADAVRSYLDRLHAIGALHEPLQAGPRVRVSLNGPLRPRDAGLRLCFVSGAQAGRLLLREGTRARGHARTTAVVVEGGPMHSAERESRRELARWLLRNERDVASDKPRLQLFARGNDGVAVEFLVAAEQPNSPASPGSIAHQLGMVRALDVDQIPLVAAEAAHPYFPARVSGYGLNFEAVGDHLLRVFLARSLLRPGADGHVRFRAGTTRQAPATLVPTRIPAARAAGASVAGSLAGLHLKLLEEVAATHEGVGGEPWQEVDLLAEPADGHPATGYLATVLRERNACLPARWRWTPGRLAMVESGGHRTFSFLPERARAAVLMATVRDQFYPPGESLPADAAAVLEPEEFASGDELRSLVRERAAHLARLGLPDEVAVRRLRCWGLELWAGLPATALPRRSAP